MTFKFRCKCCNEIHEGMPSFGSDTPAIVHAMPEEERAARVELGSDDCIIDDERFLVRGCIDIPVHGEAEPFTWGVWVDISRDDYLQWRDAFHLESRAHVGPFAGYLGSILPCYPDTFNHRVVLHLRDNGTRPLVEVCQSPHPLHVEQCRGISPDRVKRICEMLMHGGPERAD